MRREAGGRALVERVGGRIKSDAARLACGELGTKDSSYPALAVAVENVRGKPVQEGVMLLTMAMANVLCEVKCDQTSRVSTGPVR